MTESLEQIATKHKTTKVPHGFMPIYERMVGYLRDDVITLIEIGVEKGASIRTWHEYFKNGVIYGFDAIVQWKPDLKNVNVLECNVNDENRIKSLMGVIGEVDIIIDDGSHRVSDQLNAFNVLWDYLKPGGWYVIEDLFTIYDKQWNPKNQYTIMDEIGIRMKDILVGGDSIQEVHWFGRNDINGILFLRKRNEPYRLQPMNEFNL